VTVHQHGRIHCAGGGTRDPLYLQPWFFQEAIKDAPCESTMCAAALQGKIDQNWIAISFCHGIGKGFRHFASRGACGHCMTMRAFHHHALIAAYRRALRPDYDR